MTLKMMGKTDVTFGRAPAATRWSRPRAPFGCATIVAAAVVQWNRDSGLEHNEADLESKMIDSILFLKGTILRPPMS